MSDNQTPLTEADIREAMQAMREAIEAGKIAQAEIARLTRALRWRGPIAAGSAILGTLAGQAVMHVLLHRIGG